MQIKNKCGDRLGSCRTPILMVLEDDILSSTRMGNNLSLRKALMILVSWEGTPD